MPEDARGVDAAVVEFADGRGVDVRWEGEGVTHEPVLELRYEFGLPIEALDLPGPEGEGGYGDERWRRGVRNWDWASEGGAGYLG